MSRMESSLYGPELLLEWKNTGNVFHCSGWGYNAHAVLVGRCAQSNTHGRPQWCERGWVSRASIPNFPDFFKHVEENGSVAHCVIKAAMRYYTRAHSATHGCIRGGVGGLVNAAAFMASDFEIQAHAC
jgi:hypothetical protein